MGAFERNLLSSRHDVPREVSEISLRSPVSVVLISIRSVGFSDRYLVGICKPSFSISSLVSGFGGYGDEVYSEVSRFNSKDRPMSSGIRNEVLADVVRGLPLSDSLPFPLYRWLLTRISRDSVTNVSLIPGFSEPRRKGIPRGRLSTEARKGLDHDNVPNSTRIATFQLYSRGSNEKQANHLPPKLICLGSA